MTDSELQIVLENAIEPYFLAFAQVPSDAAFKVTVTNDVAIGELSLGNADFDRVDHDAALRAHFEKAFGTLSTTLSPTKIPSWKYRKAA